MENKEFYDKTCEPNWKFECQELQRRNVSLQSENRHLRNALIEMTKAMVYQIEYNE